MTIYSLDVFLSLFWTVHCSISGSNYCFLSCIQVSEEAGKAGLVFPSLEEFSSLLWSTQSNPLVKKAEVDIFLELSCFFYDPVDVGNLISGYSAFSKTSLYISKFSVHILLKPSLKVFEYYLASMWNECNYVVVWTVFGIALLWDWKENWPFSIFFQNSATAEFSKLPGMLSTALSQAHLLEFEIAQLEFCHLH